MRTSLIIYTAALLGAASASTNATLDALVDNASTNLLEILKARDSTGATCNSTSVVVRKDWYILRMAMITFLLTTYRSVLTSAEKISYIDAVKCLRALPATTPLEAAPGVRSRFDDFGATHVNQTAYIHWTVSVSSA